MITKPKGTKDIGLDNSYKWDEVFNVIQELSKLHNLVKVTTPTFEEKKLFVQTVGDGTDVVNKELYEFKDKKDRELALRPEGTAGVLRHYIEEKKFTIDNLGYWYFGPMFRYERPQQGRQREFYQYGVELLGEDSLINDLEVITLGNEIIKKFNLKNIVLNINCLGNSADRKNYSDKLKELLTPNKDKLCEKCQSRLEDNPLRILDCKECGPKDFVQVLPNIMEFVNEHDKERFDEIISFIELHDIPYEVNNKLVRGLGYYSGVVFEFVNNDPKQGAKSTIIGGGRYSEIISHLGGPKNVSGIGLAIGIERLIIALDNSGYEWKKPKLNVAIIVLTKDINFGFNFCLKLREAGFSAQVQKFKDLKKGFKWTDKMEPQFITVVGEKELESKQVTIKSKVDGREKTVDINKAIEFVKEVNYVL